MGEVLREEFDEGLRLGEGIPLRARAETGALLVGTFEVVGLEVGLTPERSLAAESEVFVFAEAMATEVAARGSSWRS